MEVGEAVFRVVHIEKKILSGVYNRSIEKAHPTSNSTYNVPSWEYFANGYNDAPQIVVKKHVICITYCYLCY